METKPMPVNDPLDIPVTRSGAEKTTLAKALDDQEEQEAIKRAARRCTECGRYQTHEQLTSVPDDDGGTRRPL